MQKYDDRRVFVSVVIVGWRVHPKVVTIRNGIGHGADEVVLGPDVQPEDQRTDYSEDQFFHCRLSFKSLTALQNKDLLFVNTKLR